MSRHQSRPPRLPGVPMVVVPPGSDTVEVTLRHIDSDTDKAGWDQLPALFWLYHHPLGVGVYKPPMRQHLARMHPAEMLTHLAGAAHLLGWATRPGLLGLVLVNEAWAVSCQSDTATEASIMLDASQRRIHTRPDRVECRLSIMVTADGRQAGLYRERGGDEPRLTDASEWTGEVMPPLRRLLAAVLPLAKG